MITKQNRSWWILIAISIMVVMFSLDMSIVNLAVPTIARELHASLTNMQWVVNAYFMTTTLFLVIGGRLGDIFGKKRIYYAGCALFAIVSFMCGLSQTVWVLVGFRALQGIGFGLVFPVVMAFNGCKPCVTCFYFA